MSEVSAGNKIYFQPELSVGSVINFRYELHAVVQLSYFGFRFKLMPIRYEGRGKWYVRTGEPFWIRRSMLKEAEVLEDFCQITV